MTCRDEREQLSALLDDALGPAERQALEAHLAACADCRQELEQLRATVTLLGRLPAARAPAGFVDRVMTAAYRPPWPRRVLDTLFRPLRVKLPLEAAALLLVGVSALYVYHQVPEVRELAPPARRDPAPAAPLVSPEQAAPRAPESRAPRPGAPGGAKPGAAESERAAPAAPGDGRAPARATPPGIGEAPLAARRDQEGRDASGAAREAEPSMKPEAEPSVKPKTEPSVKPKAEPSMKKEATPPGRGPEGAPAASELADAPKAARSSEPAAAAPPPGPPPPEAAGRVGSVAPAPAAPPAPERGPGEARPAAKAPVARRLVRAVDASGRLVVPAREPAEAALDALLGRLGARRLERRLEGDRGLVVIDVLVPGPRYRELLEGLAGLGRWVTDHEPATLPPQLRLEVALIVEP